MAAELRAITSERRMAHRRPRTRAMPPARVIRLPRRLRWRRIGTDGLLAGSAGVATLAVWDGLGGSGLTWFEAWCLPCVGMAASWLAAVAERRPGVGFGVVMLFVVATAVQLFVTMLGPDADGAGGAIAAAGDAAATAAVVLVLWRRRPWLAIRP